MKWLLFFLLCPYVYIAQPALDAVEKLIERKEYIKAEVEMDRYLDEHPDDLRAKELLGDVYAYQKKWDQAIDQYDRLVDESPNIANYHYKYGGALGMKALTVNRFRALSLISDIKHSFLKAAELDPNHIDTRWALVKLYVQLPKIVGGSMGTALKYADELAALSPVDGHLAKGYIYEEEGEPELAETHYKEAVLIGGSRTCFDALAKYYEKQKQPLKAMATLFDAKQALKSNVLNYEIGKVSAEYGVELNKGEQSLSLYLKNYSPNDGVPKAWAYYRMAQIYRHRDDKAEAQKYIGMAEEANPEIKLFEEERIRIEKQ